MCNERSGIEMSVELGCEGKGKDQMRNCGEKAER